MPENEDDFKKLPTVDFKGLEVFAVGTFNGDTYEIKDLEAMVSALPKAGFRPTVKAGHADGQEDEKAARKIFGAPALGYIDRIYIKGKKLFADLVQVPKKFADLIKAGAYRRVSAEIYWNYTDDASGKKFPRVLKAVSFLGAEIPALSNLKEIESLYKRIESGALCAYDAEGNEFRLYEIEKEYFLDSAGISEFLTRYPRKPKDSANYRAVEGASISDRDEEICENCRYFIFGFSACSLVEGYIEPTFTSDLFEKRTVVFENKGEENYADDPKIYIIRKIGDEFCLIAKGSGKKLGCHPTREKAIEQERAIKTRQNAEKDPDKKPQGGTEMDEKQIEELKAQQAKEKDEAVKKLNGEHDEKLEALKKEYEEKLAAANKDKEKNEQAIQKSDEKNVELSARMAMLERKDRENEVNSWIKDRKTAGKMLPVEETKVRAIASYLCEKQVTHTYADGDKEIKESLLDTFKALFSDEMRKSKGVFQELTDKDPPDKRPEVEDPGEEATRRAVEYMKSEEKDGRKIDLKTAYTAVFRKDPELRQRYNEMRKQ